MIEISRNQRSKSAQSFQPALTVTEYVQDRVAVRAGHVGRAAQADAVCRQVGGDPIDLCVQGKHERDQSTIYCASQAPAQKDGLAMARRTRYAFPMPHEANRCRAAIQEVMDELELDATSWSRKANLGKNTLQSFMKPSPKKPNPSLTLRVICALADAVKVHPYRLMGIDPPEQPVDEELLDVAEDMLAQSTRTDEGTAEAVQNALRLIRASRRARIRGKSAGVALLQPPSPPTSRR